MSLSNFGSLTKQDVASFEQAIGFSLPIDYSQFLLNSDGAKINNGYIYVPDLSEEILLDSLFGINTPKSLNLKTWYDEYSDEMPPSSLIIGRDPGGNFLLFTTEGDEVGIYYWDHTHFFEDSSEEEGNTYFIANSFTEFLSKIDHR